MGRLKVLIVEDDKAIWELYDNGLSDDLFEKTFADNGKEGLRLYHSLKPDIMVLDIMLPVMTGYSLLKEIRIKLCDSSTTIIMATSLSGKNDIVDCVRIGIQGYIMKPFKVKEIGGLIMKYRRGKDS